MNNSIHVRYRPVKSPLLHSLLAKDSRTAQKWYKCKTTHYLFDIWNDNPFNSVAVRLIIEVHSKLLALPSGSHRPADGKPFIEEDFDNPHGDIAVGPSYKNSFVRTERECWHG